MPIDSASRIAINFLRSGSAGTKRVDRSINRDKGIFARPGVMGGRGQFSRPRRRVRQGRRAAPSQDDFPGRPGAGTVDIRRTLWYSQVSHLPCAFA
ncbi:hypothetical protein GCM10010166_52670 [Couchioplanes caeruleus subsp. azureus]|nr:hypothetical protein GCM10010166_52670 [Couchioplanes caeruleus subsp. azureus]